MSRNIAVKIAEEEFQTFQQDNQPNLQNTSIIQHLEQIEVSKLFRTRPEQFRLLAYLVFEVLEGRSAHISASTIARDLFETRGSYVPQKHSYIRVAIFRLRKNLEDYYGALPAQEASGVIIRLPKGTYIPDIQVNQTQIDQMRAPVIDFLSRKFRNFVSYLNPPS